MKFDHTVKYGGIYYPPNTEIAEKNTIENQKESAKKSKGGAN